MTRQSITGLLLLASAAASGQTVPQDSSDVWNADPLGLETVVVTGTRTPKALKDIPVVTRVITAEDIRKVDATNIKDILQQELPGLEFTYSMGQQVMNMGGYDGNNILFLIDGERMAGESMDNIDFTRIDMSGIERIEIVKGAASTLYGSSAMGGVVNIITKHPSDSWSANVNTRYEGATKEWRHGASADFTVGKINSMTTFQMTDADSLSLRGEESSLAAYGSRTYNVKERLIWNVAGDFRLTARAGYFFRERYNSEQTHERYRDLNYGLKSNWDITPLQNIEIAYSFDQYDKSDYAVRTDKDVRDYSNRQNILRALYNVRMPQWNSLLTAGMDYMNDYLLSYQFADDNKHHVQNTLDMYAQWDYTPTEKWNIIGGVRFDYFSAARRSMPTWKLAAMYKIGSHNSLRLSYASGFRAPSLKELYMDFFMGSIFMIYGNPDLKSETDHNISFTFEHNGSIWNELKYSFSATGRYNFFHNYITTATVERDGAYGQMYVNVANQQIAGVDANFQMRHRCGLSGRVSYAFTKNIVEKGQPDLTAARPHSLTWRLDYGRQWGRWYGLDVALSGRFLSAVDVAEYASTMLDDVQEVHYEGYAIWKFSLSQRIAKGATVNFAADNLFGYKPSSYYANSPVTTGRTYTLGISIDIDKLCK